MALVAVVTLPKGVSVVLISINSLKISRASARSAGGAVGNALCARAAKPADSAMQINALAATPAQNRKPKPEEYFLSMKELYEYSPFPPHAAASCCIPNAARDILSKAACGWKTHRMIAAFSSARLGDIE